jgi:GT2 family glycosyltransferase
MIEVAEENSRVGAVGSVLYHMKEPEEVQAWGGGKVSMWWGLSRYHKDRVPEQLLHYITGASLMIRSAALEELGLLDETFFMYWEDADFGLRLRKAGWGLAVADDSHVWHKEFASTGRNSVLTDAYFSSSAVRFFEKHALVPFVPIFVGTGGRTLKRLLRRDLEGAKAVWSSAFANFGLAHGQD